MGRVRGPDELARKVAPGRLTFMASWCKTIVKPCGEHFVAGERRVWIPHSKETDRLTQTDISLNSCAVWREARQGLHREGQLQVSSSDAGVGSSENHADKAYNGICHQGDCTFMNL